MPVATTKKATAELKASGGIQPIVRYARNHHAVNAMAEPSPNEMRFRESAQETYTMRIAKTMSVQ